MGEQKDSTYIIVTLFLFLVAVVAMVLMTSSFFPSLPEPPISPLLTGYAVASGEAVDPVYAPPWDVFIGSNPLFFEVEQPDYSVVPVGGQVTITTSVDRPGSYIYKRFYHYDGSNWHDYGPGGWTKDSYETSFSVPLTGLADNENYVLAYTCDKNPAAAHGWDCGCKDPDDPVCLAFVLQTFDGPGGLPPADSCGAIPDCSPQYCHDDTLTCVDCLEDDHCASGYCDPNSHLCVECYNDEHCEVPTPQTPYCDLDSCVECIHDGDCAGDEACLSNSCVPDTEEDLLEGDFTVSAYGVLYKIRRFTQSTATYPSYAPVASQAFFDRATRKMYLSDHIGFRSYKLNKLDQVNDLHDVSYIELLARGQKYWCQITSAELGIERNTRQWKSKCCDIGLIENDEMFVSKKICILGDEGGHEGQRGTLYGTPNYGDILFPLSTGPFTHNGNLLLFEEDGDDFTLTAEFLPGSGAVIARERSPGENAVAVLGTGVSSVTGRIVHIITTPAKRYGIASPKLYGDSNDFDNYHLIDMTNIDVPVDLGVVSNYGLLREVVAEFMGEWEPSYIDEYLVIVEDGSDHILLDYSNPVLVQELDRWPASEGTRYTGGIGGLLSGYGYVSGLLEDTTLYLHVPGGISASAIESDEYAHLNPIKINDCYSPGACWLGQLWKRELGGSWEKIMNTQNNNLQVFDDKVFFYGRFIDPSGTHYGLKSNGDMGTSHLYPGSMIWLYDLTEEEWVMKDSLDLDPAHIQNHCRTPLSYFGLPVNKQDGKYYLYIPNTNRCILERDPSTFIIAYEISSCDGDDCDEEADDEGEDLCVPDCDGKVCGASDECGDYCGNPTCEPDFECHPVGIYETGPRPSCWCKYDWPNYGADDCDPNTPIEYKVVYENSDDNGPWYGIEKKQCYGLSTACSQWKEQKLMVYGFYKRHHCDDMLALEPHVNWNGYGPC